MAVCDESQAAVDAIAQVRSEPRGTIRVTCPNTLAQTVVGPLLPSFLARHPHVQVHMQISNRVVDLIEEGVDVALRVRASLADSGSLVIKQLGRSRSLIVAAPALLQRQGVPVAPEDLARMDSLAMSSLDGVSSWRLIGPKGREADVMHHPRYVADDLLTLKFAVLAGVGVGLLPDYLCSEELADGRLVELLPDWHPEIMIVHAAFPSRRGLSPAVRAFLDFLGENMGEAQDRAAGPA